MQDEFPRFENDWTGTFADAVHGPNAFRTFESLLSGPSRRSRCFVPCRNFRLGYFDDPTDFVRMECTYVFCFSSFPQTLVQLWLEAFLSLGNSFEILRRCLGLATNQAVVPSLPQTWKTLDFTRNNFRKFCLCFIEILLYLSSIC